MRVWKQNSKLQNAAEKSDISTLQVKTPEEVEAYKNWPSKTVPLFLQVKPMLYNLNFLRLNQTQIIPLQTILLMTLLIPMYFLLKHPFIILQTTKCIQ